MSQYELRTWVILAGIVFISLSPAACVWLYFFLRLRSDRASLRLLEESHILAEQKRQLDREKTLWQLEKENWEAERDVAINEAALRMLDEKVAILEDQAARRGGEQLDRETEEDEGEPED